MASVLTGERPANAGGAVPGFHPTWLPTTRRRSSSHTSRGQSSAAVFGDAPELAHHSAAAIPLLPVARGLYPAATARLVRGLACAEQARTADPVQRTALLAEFDEMYDWLAARATEARPRTPAPAPPARERAGLGHGGLQSGRHRVRRSPWRGGTAAASLAPGPHHRARRRFALAHGLDHAGWDLLAEARLRYDAWGATAKVAQLDWASPAVLTRAQAEADGHASAAQPTPRVTTGTIDLFGILSASHALSSETSVEHLHDRVAQVLSGMTGATGVHLVLWDGDSRRWMSPGSAGQSGPPGDRVDERTAPMSVLRYVQRTGDTVIVDDATRDDRFSRDPYLAEVGRC